VISSRHWKRSTLARLSSLGQPARARSVGGLNWPGRNEGLTDRESEILALITQGKSNADVAALTFLSPITVKPYTDDLPQDRRRQSHAGNALGRPSRLHARSSPH
jgi:DNA-binding NarL/FixJ family response regulator